MNYKLWFIGTITFALIGVAPAFVGAQTTAVGPYYAPPAWDQTIPCTSLANCPRFIVLSNMNSAAVLDRETGLVWERAPGDVTGNGGVDSSDAVTQFVARGGCNRLTLGNRMGWRLPTVQELLTLIDGDPNNASSPRLPPGHPFININVQGAHAYWTSTFHESQGGAAVFLANGAITFNGSAIENFRWCVRGASPTTLLP